MAQPPPKHWQNFGSPFTRITLERTIALRWTLRDIKAKGLKLSPVSESDMETLLELGNAPVLTQSGHAALD
jgi:hypothetical protein